MAYFRRQSVAEVVARRGSEVGMRSRPQAWPLLWVMYKVRRFTSKIRSLDTQLACMGSARPPVYIDYQRRRDGHLGHRVDITWTQEEEESCDMKSLPP
jgi:hypothetical protein